MAGLLIINADDFGGNRLATDRIAECIAGGSVTSTSAMVYMGDSERAAAIAAAQRISAGLHLNLTQELDDPATPAPVRERQARVARYFAGRRMRRFTYNPAMSAQVRHCVTDQLECFRELFGHEPTHIDGHNHAHLSPTVLLTLPRGIRARTGESPRAHGGPGVLMRRARHAAIARRYVTTDCFFAIERLGPAPSEEAIERLLELADRARVEIMVHPDRDHDYRLLKSDAWMRVMRRRTTGSYEQL